MAIGVVAKGRELPIKLGKPAALWESEVLIREKALGLIELAVGPLKLGMRPLRVLPLAFQAANPALGLLAPLVEARLLGGYLGDQAFILLLQQFALV